MRMNKFLVLLTTILFILCLGTTEKFGQYKPKTVGSIKLSIGSKGYSVQIPVNEKFPIFKGESFGEYASHGDSCQVDSFAVADKNLEFASLNMLFVVYKYHGRTKVIKKQFTLKKNQKKNFRWKYKQFDFEIVANYQPETK
jgi:hypothetical protein